MSKEFRVAFPVYATGYDSVKLTDEELVEFEKLEDVKQREYLFNKVSPPALCHQCNDDCEEIEADLAHVGDNFENIGFWDKEEE